MGRPAWVPTAEAIEKVEGYAALGLTKEQIANCLGISYQTLNEKSKEYPEFAEAIKTGLDKGIARMANLLIKHAEAGSVPSVIFFLKARAKWSDQNLDEVEKTIKNELDAVREMVQRCMREQTKS
jgi:DNA-binding XRE family transcriptional regulator